MWSLVSPFYTKTPPISHRSCHVIRSRHIQADSPLCASTVSPPPSCLKRLWIQTSNPCRFREDLWSQRDMFESSSSYFCAFYAGIPVCTLNVTVEGDSLGGEYLPITCHSGSPLYERILTYGATGVEVFFCCALKREEESIKQDRTVMVSCEGHRNPNETAESREVYVQRARRGNKSRVTSYTGREGVKGGVSRKQSSVVEQ